MVRAKCGTLAALISLIATVALAQGVAQPPAMTITPDGSPLMGYRDLGGDPHFVATADVLFLQRSSACKQQLLSEPVTGREMLNASNLDFPIKACPSVSLRWEYPAGLGLELSYYGIDNWQSKAKFSDAAFPFGVGYLPIDTTITMPITDAQFQYTSALYNAEANIRYSFNDWLTPLVGFRWVEFNDRYMASGTDEIFSGPFDLVVRGRNHLYGSQIGVEARLLDRETPFWIDVWAKTGIFANVANQDNEYVDTVRDFSASAHRTHLSYLGEAGVLASWQISKYFAFRGGYRVMWLKGLALAPSQISETDFAAGQAGVNSSETLFCHGADAGFEVKW